MKRLIEDTVFLGLVIAWRFAGSPTLRSPFPLSKKPTIEGVVLRPSLLAITTGSLPSITATHELVVPKSIPIIFPICLLFSVPRFIGALSQSLCQGGCFRENMTEWQNYDAKVIRDEKQSLNAHLNISASSTANPSMICDSNWP